MLGSLVKVRWTGRSIFLNTEGRYQFSEMRLMRNASVVGIIVRRLPIEDFVEDTVLICVRGKMRYAYTSLLKVLDT